MSKPIDLEEKKDNWKFQLKLLHVSDRVIEFVESLLKDVEKEARAKMLQDIRKAWHLGNNFAHSKYDLTDEQIWDEWKALESEYLNK